jgi:hypothetical protein
MSLLTVWSNGLVLDRLPPSSAPQTTACSRIGRRTWFCTRQQLGTVDAVCEELAASAEGRRWLG